ncbi:MAG: efflux RND transporter periplasmic adaptor subunit [Thermodesulfobacteriota bacterium]
MRVLVIIILLLAGGGAVSTAAELPPFDGLVEPKEQVEFSSPVPGILEKVTVDRGAWVKKGQVLARLNSGVEKAAVNLARARYEFGKRKMERNQQLYEKKLMSAHHKDETETEILLAELELKETQEHLKLRTIRSTVEGVVVERQGAPGEYVGEEPFLTIAQLHPLIVEIIVPVTYYGSIKKGDSGKVELEEPVSGSYSAKVIMVDQVIDAATGTFGVRLELPNPKLTLPAGLKCRVVF